MAFAFQKTYNPEIERLLCQYYQSLSEKDRRRFAALEAIAASLQAQAVWAGPRIVRRILDGLGFARRQMAKVLPGGDSPHRDAQFRHIAHLLQEFLEADNPILSIDTKKKEFLGTLYRDGKVYCQQALKAFDHDFPRLASGVIIPHGIYDLARNQGWLHLGLSRDTTAFACESLRLFWSSDGRRLYPNASAILLLCDGGGSNSGHKHLFKEDLQALVNDLEVPIRVAHYPAYCSKFNPIERRLFSHVTRACQGVLFDSLQTVIPLSTHRSGAANFGPKATSFIRSVVMATKLAPPAPRNQPMSG